MGEVTDRGLQDRVRVRARSFRGLQCRQRLVVPGRLELPKTLRGGRRVDHI